jgi:hypothetical protein
MNFHQLPIRVGNCPSVKGREWGSIIDSFETVIRINSFPFTGYEREAGSRCDVWALTPTKVRPVTPCREIVVFVVSRDRAVQQREYAWSHYGDRLTLVNRSEVIRLATPFGYTKMESVWPSTGATAILDFSTKYPLVVYHGFDHLVGSESRTRHYYPVDGAPLSGVHVPRLEQSVFETLVSRGQAAKLADLLQDA